MNIPNFKILKIYENCNDLLNHKKIKFFARDNFACCHCGAKGIYFVRGQFLNGNTYSKRGTIQVFTSDYKLLTIDHIIPRAKYGRNSTYNKQTLCADCNFKKGAVIYTNDLEKLEMQ